jgi:serine/threonine protein kinase
LSRSRATSKKNTFSRKNSAPEDTAQSTSPKTKSAVSPLSQTHSFPGEKVAIKAMQKSRISDYESFQNEINILRSLDHPNIIKLFETWETDRICFLVTE